MSIIAMTILQLFPFLQHVFLGLTPVSSRKTQYHWVSYWVNYRLFLLFPSREKLLDICSVPRSVRPSVPFGSRLKEITGGKPHTYHIARSVAGQSYYTAGMKRFGLDWT